MRKNRLASATYELFLRFVWLRRIPVISRFWSFVFGVTCSVFSGATVETVVHGYPVILNYGYTYPLYARLFPTLNNPLVELVYQASVLKRAPVSVLDVGAAIGDTILLIAANCPGMLGSFYCVDGDPEFFDYLKVNLKDFKNGKLFFTLLSDSEKKEPGLVRIHEGTASARGVELKDAVPLDSLLGKESLESLDVLKIDTDGFDGKVLVGARKVLTAFTPSVIFEWHPVLCQKTGNDWRVHFEVLISCGYDRFVCFDNTGHFSHSMSADDKTRIAEMTWMCLEEKRHSDYHFDIIALHKTCQISQEALADLFFSKARRSAY